MNSNRHDRAARRRKQKPIGAGLPPKAKPNEDDPEIITARLLDRFINARVQMLTTPEPATDSYRAGNEALWHAVADSLSHHRSTGAPLPQEMIFELESELRDWLSGVPSSRLPLLTRRGRRLSPVTRSCQLHAVMYLVASPDITGNRQARKTIKDQFLIAASTLQRWKNNHQKEARAALENFYSDMAPEGRTKLLSSLMKASARQYHRQIKASKVPGLENPRSQES